MANVNDYNGYFPIQTCCDSQLSNCYLRLYILVGLYFLKILLFVIPFYK